MSEAILITGGAGFIGSHLGERLIADGRRVVCLDLFDDYYAPDAKRRNLTALEKQGAFTLIEGDLRDEATLDRAFGATELAAVVHLGARPGVRASFADPLLYEEVNVRGTIQVLQAAQRHAVPRFVLGSSSSVYGASPRTPFREEDAADRPLSPYAASKRAAEHFAYAWSHAHGLEVACLRFFTVYGPRQRPDMAIPKFTACIDRGEPIPVYGDGTQGRDFTFVTDIVSGIIAAATRPLDGFEVFNLGRGELVELNLVLETLQDLLGKKARIEHLPRQLGDAPVTLADIGRATDRLGYAPQVSIDEGLKRWVEWWRRQ